MRDAADVGRRVLEGLDRGRAISIEQSRQRAAALRAAVLQLAADDLARGRKPRGRAGRIARKLRGLASERHIRRILSDTFSCMSDLRCSNAVDEQEHRNDE